MSTAKNKKVEEIKRDLFSGDDTTVLKALHRTREEGDVSLIEPLIALFAADKNESIHREVVDLLSTLKVSGAEEAFITAIRSPEMKTRRKELLGFIWSSGLQPVHHVAELCQVAVEGTFEEVLDVLTIVEGFESTVSEDQLLEGIGIIRTHLNGEVPREKAALLADLLIILEQWLDDSQDA